MLHDHDFSKLATKTEEQTQVLNVKKVRVLYLQVQREEARSVGEGKRWVFIYKPRELFHFQMVFGLFLAGSGGQDGYKVRFLGCRISTTLH